MTDSPASLTRSNLTRHARAAKAARALLATMDLDPLVADLIADRTGAP